MNLDEFDFDRGLTRLSLTLAPIEMAAPAPWRCQEHQISGRARQCLCPLGYGVHYSDMTQFIYMKLDSI